VELEDSAILNRDRSLCRFDLGLVDVSVIKTIIFEAVGTLSANAKAHSQSSLTGSVAAIPCTRHRRGCGSRTQTLRCSTTPI
jgi:hypothetical protein